MARRPSRPRRKKAALPAPNGPESTGIAEPAPDAAVLPESDAAAITADAGGQNLAAPALDADGAESLTMPTDLLAGTIQEPVSQPEPMARPRVLVFDSGVGGLTVAEEIARRRPDADLIYAADEAAFPYGRLEEAALRERVLTVLEKLIALQAPDLVVIACNTASTLALPALRERFTLPFVGTVPAIKPAALASASRRIAVLATPGTVARDYTQDLIRAHATACRVTLVGSARLASYAEAEMAGQPVPDEAIAAEIAPCFVTDEEGRTDTVVLACTHYPLMRPRFDRLAPWPVAWIDSGAAIARRVDDLLGPAPRTLLESADGDNPSVADETRLPGLAITTLEAAPIAPLLAAFQTRGFGRFESVPIPFG